MAANNVKKPKILIIDDDPAILQTFGLLLEKHGYVVSQANYALPALFQVLREVPDLILADLDMPIMNGLDLLHQFKTHLETRHIPVIVVTGSGHPEDRHAAFEAGCAGFLSKPVEPKVLIDEIGKLLRHHKPGKHEKLAKPAAKTRSRAQT